MHTIEVAVARSPAHCYQLLCAPHRVPEWVPGVADAHILATDDRGRPTRVRFVAMPARGSIEYVVGYDYDDAARRVRWANENTELREMRGEATVLDHNAPDACIVRYALRAAPGESLPPWAQAVLAEESPETVAYAFRRWAER